MKLKERLAIDDKLIIGDKLIIDERIVKEISEQDFYIAELKALNPGEFKGVVAYFNYYFENSKKHEDYTISDLIFHVNIF